MIRRRLIWQLYPATLLILLAALLTVAWFAGRELRSTYLAETEHNLLVRSRMLRTQLQAQPRPWDPAAIQGLCQQLGRETKTRFTIIAPSGAILADSERDPAELDNHSDRPEFKGALAGEHGRATRYSNSLKRDMMYVAVAQRQGAELRAVVRAALPLDAISSTLGGIYRRLAFAGLLIALLAGLISYWLARRITHPLQQMQAGAERLADGDLRYRFAEHRGDELGALAGSLNAMARQLDDRLRTVTTQRNELEAVLGAMVESVLVVDDLGRLLRANRAAQQLLGLNAEIDVGTPIAELLDHDHLVAFIDELLRSHASQEALLGMGAILDQVLQVHGTPLLDAQNKRLGALLVLHDVTRVKRLERVRQDFVANVSHELKTPITSIQGFVETLRDGALHDEENADRFLGIVDRQARRLNAIVEDLLLLSRIEQEGAPLRQRVREVYPVAALACQDCQAKADARDIRIELEGDEDLLAPINDALLEQAVMNLVDNAIKYSPTGTVVKVRVVSQGDEVVIAVTDQGGGIPPADQPRLFERFYRVDKARSRELGGTGLGLSIVKHITTVHGGRVSLESEVGAGSTFSLHLPRSREGIAAAAGDAASDQG